MLPKDPYMIRLDFDRLFSALTRVRGLQRKDWQHNQSGTDRGIEAVLIQRSPRELATYALARIRITAMPELRQAASTIGDISAAVADLRAWAVEQGGAAQTLANLIPHRPATCDYLLAAALATLRYYRQREDENPIVRQPWTNEGLHRAATLDYVHFNEKPIAGAFWEKKLARARSLVWHIRGSDWEQMSDAMAITSLRSVVGEQTAAMVALFWLKRPVPVLDSYLERLLRRHGFIPKGEGWTARSKAELGSQLVKGAEAYSAKRHDWRPARVLTCLYLWSCELGRLHCDCQDGPGASCPLVPLL